MRLGRFSMIALLALCGAAPALAEDRLFVLKEILVDPGAPISRGVRTECELDSHISNMLFSAAQDASPGVVRVTSASEVPSGERMLTATIVSVYGIQGGGWTGAKSITIRADLRQNGQIVDSRIVTRRVGKSFRGIIGDTCLLFSRAIPGAGSEVQLWLRGVAAVSKERTAAGGAPQTEPALLVQVPAVIADDATVRETWRSECGLPSLVGNQVLKEIGFQFEDIRGAETIDPSYRGRALRLEILDLKAESESLRTSRTVTLRATVVEGTKVVSTQILEGRASRRRGSMESGCAILEYACQALGREVAKWLAAGPVGAAPAATGNPVSLDDLPLQQEK